MSNNLYKITLKNKEFLIYKFKELYQLYNELDCDLYLYDERNPYLEFVMKEFNKFSIDDITIGKIKELANVIEHYATKCLFEIEKKRGTNNKDYQFIKDHNKIITDSLCNMIRSSKLFARIYIDSGAYEYYIRKRYSFEEILFNIKYEDNILSFNEWINSTIDIIGTKDEVKEYIKELAYYERDDLYSYNEKYDDDIYGL